MDIFSTNIFSVDHIKIVAAVNQESCHILLNFLSGVKIFLTD